MKLCHAVFMFGVIVLAGCATKGSSISEAALNGDPTAMAAEGARLNTEGATLVREAEARLVTGRKQVRDGEAKVQDGSTRVTNARLEYKDLSAASGKAADPKTVAREAKKIKAAGDRWEDAIDTIKDGNCNQLINRRASDISLAIT